LETWRPALATALKRGDEACALVDRELIVHALGSTRAPHRPHQGRDLLRENSSLQPYAAGLDDNLDRTRMRHDTTQSRAHALSHAVVFGRRAIERRPGLRRKPLNAVGDVTCAGVESTPYFAHHVLRLITEARATTAAARGIEPIHRRGRQYRGA